MSNVILLIIDDVGIDQLSCFDDQNHYTSPYAYAHTPNLNQLAAEGVRFTQFRASPLCSPSRGMILTGKYPFRTGCGGLNKVENVSPSYVELGGPCLASLLPGKRAAIGKWHLGLPQFQGGTMPDHPVVTAGFGSWRGLRGNVLNDPEPPPGLPTYRNFMFVDGGQSTHIAGHHLTGYTRSYASRWLQLNKTSDFFLYLAFNAAHDPYSLFSMPDVSEHGFGAVPDNFHNTQFRAYLESLDYHIGILKGVIPPDTYLIVIGDNGTALQASRAVLGEPRYPIGHPLWVAGDETTQLSLDPVNPNRVKNSVYEGGIRTPLIVWGSPGTEIVQGTSDYLVDAVDLFPTIAELRGIDLATPDSFSFVCDIKPSCDISLRTFSFMETFLPNGPDSANEPRTRQDRAYLRDGRWKLIRRLDETDLFFDLLEDPIEENDLGVGHPEFQETLDRMLELLQS